MPRRLLRYIIPFVALKRILILRKKVSCLWPGLVLLSSLFFFPKQKVRVQLIQLSQHTDVCSLVQASFDIMLAGS